MASMIALCNSSDLVQGGRAVPFDIVYAGQTCRAFAIRYQGQVHAYLNRCRHVPTELDWQDGRFFDSSGLYLICSLHGALYRPDSGLCVAALEGAPREFLVRSTAWAQGHAACRFEATPAEPGP
jgi:nitrite reductase/ring-hydroxylating ferredoxin subunit